MCFRTPFTIILGDVFFCKIFDYNMMTNITLHGIFPLLATRYKPQIIISVTILPSDTVLHAWFLWFPRLTGALKSTRTV